MKTILPFSKFLAFVFFTASLLFANVSFGQIVMLDQADLDYAPGETVYITGSGWHPGETVMLEVANLTNPEVDCGSVNPQPHVAWTTVADENGNFIASWYVNDCELDADLMLGAYGETSGFTYELFFTDSNDKFQTSGLPAGIVVNVVASYIKPNGDIVNNETVTFNSPGPSGSIGVKQNTQVVYSFPLSVISGGITYNLISSTPSSGYTNTNTAQIVTGEYIGCTSPSIGTQPLNKTITYGDNTTFSVVANGTANLDYQWQEDSGIGFVNISDGGVYSGTSTNTLMLTQPTVSMSGRTYRCVVTNGCGTVDSNGSATLTVSKKSATVVANAKSKTYGDVNPVLDAVVTGTVNGDPLNYTLATTALQFSNVGDYPITVTLGSNPNYSITSTNALLSIGQKSATVVANAKSKTYGDVNPVLDAVVSGTVNGDPLNYTLTTTALQFSNVGDYPITVTLGSNPNYSITSTNALLSIGQKSASVIPDALSKYCGQSDPVSFTGTTTGFLVSDNIIATYSRSSGESTGIYTISASLSPSTALSNYNITYNTADFTIIGITNVDASASSSPVALGSVALLSAKIQPAVSGVVVYFNIDSGNGNIQTFSSLTDNNGLATKEVLNLEVNLYKVVAIAGSGCAVSTEAYMPVYDPNGSFVTGGGWIMSPLGAYAANPSLVGKANFGFNAKYKKGNNQVDGNTEFQFRAGDLNFKSTLHESGSLVISGKKATYRGDGTINGVAGYKFTLVALDGDYNGGVAPDQFRIKIWGPNGIVYDNGLGADDNSEVSTVIGGGSIVIHEVKKKGSAKDVDTEKIHSVMISEEPIPFNVFAYPNPTVSYFTLTVESASTENIKVLVYDSAGKLLKTIEGKEAEIIQFGEDLPRGTYIAKISQGTDSKTINLMKE